MRMGRFTVVAVLGCLCLFLVVAGAQEADSPPAAVPSSVEETVTVVLAEVEILVTDKEGNAITDLRKDEITVRESGKRRKLAVLESFATRDLSARITATAVPLYSNVIGEVEDETAEPDVYWPPPPAVRHIILLFDAYNSRTQERRRWVQAAHDWVRDEMRPSDRVALAVMERAKVNVVVPFSDEQQILMGYLSSDSIVSGATYHDYMLQIRTLMDDLKTCLPAYEPDMCALSAVQSYIHEWRVRTEQTIAALRRYTASLGAIPGRKAIFYMSDGLVVDPGDVVTNAVLAMFGTDVMAYNRTQSMLATDLHFDVLDSLRVASTADVTFFTFDTRNSSMRDVSWTAEEARPLSEQKVSDPYALMFDSTRSALDTIAIQTGGRSFHGPRIEANLPRAIRAIEGLYTVGYYRDANARGKPKVKVSVDRKGAVVTYPRRREMTRRLPTTVQLELGVAKPQTQMDGWLIPLMVQIPVSELTFTKQEGRMVAEVALYGEAISQTGERVDDVYELVEVSMTVPEHRDLAPGMRFGHALGLVLQPGSYRLRARFSEPEFRRAAERAVDITVNPDGTLSTAIQEIELIQDPVQESAGDRPPDSP